MQSIQDIHKLRRSFLNLLGRVSDVETVRIHLLRRTWDRSPCKVHLTRRKLVIYMDFEEWRRKPEVISECLLKSLISENITSSTKIQKTLLTIAYIILFAALPLIPSSGKGSWQFYTITLIVAVSIILGIVFGRLIERTSGRTYRYLVQNSEIDSVLYDLLNGLKDFITCLLEKVKKLYDKEPKKIPLTEIINEEYLSQCKDKLSAYVRTYRRIIG